MKTIIAAAILLSGCAQPLLNINRNADYQAQCLSFGAMLGTAEFVQCMAMLAAGDRAAAQRQRF